MDKETANYGERNAPTSALRKVISKFNPDFHGEAASLDFYQGSQVRSTRQESKARSCILSGDLDEINAKKRLEVIDASMGFASRAEFRRNISDIVDA